MSTEPEAEHLKPHSWFRIWAELAGAWAISLAYPIYVHVASGPEALTSLGIRRLDLLVLIAVVSLLGPLIISLAEITIRMVFGEPFRRIVHGLVLGSLLALVLWQWLLGQESPELLRSLLPLALALLFAWSYVRTELVRNFALMLSFATVVVISSFSLDYPIKSEFWGHQAKASTPKIEKDVPVVMVVFDELPLASLELPDGKINPAFPNFAMLSRRADWYPGAVAVADQTNFALPSILTGEDPDPEGGNRPTPAGLADYPNSLCRIAADGGYEVHSYETITDLCRPRWNLGTQISATLRRATGVDDPYFTDELAPGGIARKVTKLLTSPFAMPWGQFDSDRSKAFDDFISGLPSDPRSFSLLHITLPHVEWIYSPDGTTYDNYKTPGDDLLVNPESAGELDRNAQMMMLQLKFTDHELGRLIRKMKADGTWDESLFVVTADHGTAFQRDGSRRILGSGNEGWIVPVPFFIKYPGQQSGRVVKGTVTGRDIAPTVMSTLGLEPLPDMHGRDLTGRDGLLERRQAAVVGTIGGGTEVDLKAVRSERRAASQYMQRLLGKSFFAPGGHSRLLGQKPAGLTEIPSEPVDPAAFEDVDTSSKQIQALYQASIQPPGGRDPGALAVALNGRIVATATPWEEAGTWHLGVVLPTAAFRDGANDIRVYEAGGGAGR